MKKSFLNRLLITYTILVCSLIMLIFSGFVLQLQKSHTKELEKLSNEKLSQYVETFDRSIDRMLQFSSSIKNIHSLDLFALSSQDRYYWRLTDLYNDLLDTNSLLAEAPYHVLLHKQNDTTVITNSGSSNIHRFLDEFQLSFNQYQQIITQLGNGRMNQERIVITDQNFIYITQKDLINAKMIVVLYSDFKNLGLDTDDTLPISFSIYDPRILDRRTQQQVQFSQQDTKNLEAMTVQELSADGESYYCQPSSYYDVVFHYSKNDTQQPGEIWKQILGLLVLSILICALACGAVAVFAVRLYRPIERIINTLLSMEDSAETKAAKSELDYLTRRVAQIRQQNQSLTELLDDNNRMLRQKLTNDVLQGTVPPEELPALLKKYQMDWMDEETVIVLFNFSDIGSERYANAEKISGQILSMLEEQLKKKCRLQCTPPPPKCFGDSVLPVTGCTA